MNNIVRCLIAIVAVLVCGPVQAQSLSDTLTRDALNQAQDSTKVKKVLLRQPVWLIRSNLPLLFTGFTPNVQAEMSLDHQDRWSVNVEAIFSWWTFSRNAYANQLILGTVELRRWLGKRWKHHTLDGWHIGLALGGGFGDVEWTSRGYQAEVYSGFVNIGWQKRFGRRKQWAIDAGIGVGYAYIPYRRYEGSSIFPEDRTESYDDHLMWQESSRTNWFGITHFNISIGYVFNKKDAAWKRRVALEQHIERNDYLHFRDSMKAAARYQRDSLRWADQTREEEIKLLPKSERREAEKQLKAERKQRKADERQASREARAAKKQAKRESRDKLKQAKAQARQERTDSLTALLSQDQTALRQQRKAEERETEAARKAQERQAKAEAKEARKLAKEQRKANRVKLRQELRLKQIEDRRQRDMEEADEKYRRSEK